MNGEQWRFRPAQTSDAAACAPLIFASGVHEFRFFLGVPDEQSLAFLRFAFALDHGHFSWRRYYVACSPDGTVLSEMSAHGHRDTRLDDPYLAWIALRFFGPRQTPGILRRGAILGGELPAPERGQVLLANFATDTRMRGAGIFTALLAHALTSGWLRCAPGGQYVLDVRLDNIRARHLYERLGFVAQPRRRPPSARLPAGLISTRMVWSGQGMVALRAQAAPSDQLAGDWRAVCPVMPSAGASTAAQSWLGAIGARTAGIVRAFLCRTICSTAAKLFAWTLPQRPQHRWHHQEEEATFIHAIIWDATTLIGCQY
ncbi:MAG: GNAT family N-acetyltransferase [Burkholderiaceae bacterium]|jgi:ribosomal protein S18 acetylase RimI-like enzyme|nr:GNAT family N-acetyltransferase [Burkholderiaceae bacterium]